MYSQIIRSENRRLKFIVYRKPTHSNRYLDFNSNNPMIHKISVIKSLVDGAFNQRLPELVEDELKFVKDTLRSDGYKTWQINKIISKKRNPILSRTPSDVTNLRKN